MNILSFGIIATLVSLVCPHLTSQYGAHDIEHWARSRQKRSLIYTSSGVQKFVISLAMNMDLKDKRDWRSLSVAWNFQWQHNLPITVLYWWNSTYFPAKGRSFPLDSTPLAPEPKDPTAALLYEIIETYMSIKGMKGRECLLRSICQNAQVDFVGGLMDHIYKRILTPERTMEDHYKDAYAMGSNGVDCYETFQCPKGRSVIDQFVQIDDVD